MAAISRGGFAKEPPRSPFRCHMRTVFGILFFLPFLVTAYWWQEHGYAFTGEAHAMTAILFLFVGLPCALISGAILFWKR